MEPRQELRQSAADLYWLAFLITADAEVSIDLAAEAVVSQNGSDPLFSDPKPQGARRLVITQALAAIREELAASARRVARSHWKEPDFSMRSQALGHGLTKAELEGVLLAIDVFPRCVVLLCVFEGLSQTEAAALLDAGPSLIAQGQVTGLRELTRNIGTIERKAANNVRTRAVAGAFAHA